MTCPICDQKPINCDCTETERQQHAEIEELRLADAEREAVECFARMKWNTNCIEYHAATLRTLLERMK
jgi:hypothetical protein